MSASERQLAEDKATREAARAVLTARLARVKGALDQRSIGARIGTEALGRAKATADQTMTIASENRWAVLATATALAGWFLRKPLMQWAAPISDNVSEATGEEEIGAEETVAGKSGSPWQRLRDWTVRKVKS